ncbi:MAG: zinc dependent phospholipase C family protein [Flavobacteriales bacterium]|nr:zinc dependent phospholipase C family protein [Flavobacteriales bacterium]MDG1780932.1 zinc dependent phospholipase C family protein [Flavobacteriales bacterium]MDG2245968.1 zinc dependent phospholipase C family protein [Flavobacteriales bacterium]
MKLLSRIIVLFVCLSTIPLKAGAPWGFFAHKRINELAVFTLPEELFGFYKDNIHFITEHAVDPDKRRYGVKGEAPRHYIDIDHYCKHDSACNPFDLVPRRWNDAVEKFSEDTLMEYGIVPWHISNMTYRLTKAFEEKNIKRILRTSAEIGHYIGDAHVPLHTTENYNGQLSGQYGIHGFWESRLPELYEPDYDFFVGKANYVESPLDKAWDVVEASHNALDSVLRFEKELTEEYDEDDKFSYEERGRMLIKVYSEEFSNAYHQRLNGQVERRMKEAVITIGSLWYTAWVNAGQPNLDEISPEEMENLKEEIAKENESKELPELRKREHDN